MYSVHHQCNQVNQYIYVQDNNTNKTVMRIKVNGLTKKERNKIMAQIARMLSYPEKCTGANIINVDFSHFGG